MSCLQQLDALKAEHTMQAPAALKSSSDITQEYANMHVASHMCAPH